MATTNNIVGVDRYTKKARSVAEYTMMRGVTDFSNAAQFNLYETGYSYLVILSVPEYIKQLAALDTNVDKMLKTVCYILEYEFRGLSGIEDITADDLEVTDGISTMNIMGKTNKQSASELSMTYTEKSGAVMTNFFRYYIEGIRDPRTQAKTYHGLIKTGKLAAGFENEVFNFMYIVTDNTLLQVERAYLLCNAWFNKAPTSIYESEKGSIDKKEIDVSIKCFVIDGEEVNKKAVEMLAYLNEKDAVTNAYTAQEGSKSQAKTVAGNVKTSANASQIIHLQNDDYNYSIFEDRLSTPDKAYYNGTTLNTNTSSAT